MFKDEGGTQRVFIKIGDFELNLRRRLRFSQANKTGKSNPSAWTEAQGKHWVLGAVSSRSTTGA